MVAEDRLAQIESLVAPVLRAHGLTLVDIEWRREGRRWVLRFTIDKGDESREPGRGLTIADCQRFSHEVGDLLDVSDVIPGSYDLEVSSPGLDRELRKERELRWAVGRVVHCWLSAPGEGRTEVSGRLQGVTEDLLILEEAGGQVRELPRSRVVKTRLEFRFPPARPQGSGDARAARWRA